MNDKHLHFSNQPKNIEIRGAKVHNLKNIDVDIPLYGITGIAGVHDELRKIFARTDDAKQQGHKAGDFSYNTGSLRCPVCDGTGEISLDVQFLPDVDVPCPACRGSRYSKDAKKIHYKNKAGEEKTLPELMDMDVSAALAFCCDIKNVEPKLRTLFDLGLGYLTLGEETPGLSGGEAQLLKLASEMGKAQGDGCLCLMNRQSACTQRMWKRCCMFFIR